MVVEANEQYAEVGTVVENTGVAKKAGDPNEEANEQDAEDDGVENTGFEEKAGGLNFESNYDPNEGADD